MIEIVVIILARACSVADLKQSAMSAREANLCCSFFLWSLPDCLPSFISTRVCSACLPKRKSLCNTKSSVGGRQKVSETLRYHLHYLETSLSCIANFPSQNLEFVLPLRFNFFITHKSNNLLLLMGFFLPAESLHTCTVIPMLP